MRLDVSGGDIGGFRAPLQDGERGTAQTVKIMRKLIDQALTQAEFVRFAVDLVRNVPAYDDSGELSAVYTWVLSNIRYTKDPVSKEVLCPPLELLKKRAGDCDCISMLLAALALALGYPARLITLGADPDFPNEFSHVYPEAEVPAGSGRWLPLDAARPGAQFGAQPPGYFRKRAWSLTDDSYQDFSGGSKRLRGLGSYHGANYNKIVSERLAGLGYDWSGVDWGSLISQTVQETPQIIAAAQGQSTMMRGPNGTVVSTGPYASFATPYTPGYASPQAGYNLPSASGALFGTALPWILMGVVAIAVFKR